FSSYRHFKIKAPVGTPLTIQCDDNAYDPHVLACFLLSEMHSIPQDLRRTVLYSKSQRKSYTLKDVKPSKIGRVQHFLNEALCKMFKSGQITQTEGTVNGEPCLSMEPSSTEKFAKNKQAGSEAYIPTLLVSSDQRFTQ
ncbi:unnamed protein product, partial [Porites evermanni]